MPRTITLTDEEVETLVDELVDRRNLYSDMIDDGCFENEDAPEEKEHMINTINNMDSILKKV